MSDVNRPYLAAARARTDDAVTAILRAVEAGEVPAGRRAAVDRAAVGLCAALAELDALAGQSVPVPVG